MLARGGARKYGQEELSYAKPRVAKAELRLAKGRGVEDRNRHH